MLVAEACAGMDRNTTTLAVAGNSFAERATPAEVLARVWSSGPGLVAPDELVLVVHDEVESDKANELEAQVGAREACMCG